MFKVLLVDDEPIITKGLTKLICWEEAGFAITGTADNAADAMDMVRRDCPDVIITDLHMPDVSGIEFIKTVSEWAGHVKLIVLSGYGEFEYAREAFRHGVVEYLLKPVTRQRLTEVLQNVSDTIQKERAFQERMALLKARLYESMPLLKQKFLLDVLKGEISEEAEILKKAGFLDMNLSGGGYVVMALSIDNMDANEHFPQKKDIVLLKFAAQNIAEEIIGSRYRAYTAESGDTLFLLLVLERGNLPVKELFDAASEVREKLEEHLKALCSIGISRLYTSVRYAAKAFNEANYALKLRYTSGQGGIIHVNSIAEQQEGRNEYPAEAEKTVIEAILFHPGVIRVAEFATLLVKAFMEASGGRQDVLSGFCHEFLVQLRRTLRGVGENPESILPFAGMAERVQAGCRTPAELSGLLREIIADSAEHVSGRRKAREYDAVQEAKNYIDANFAEELSLARVASKVFMSPTYFSALFKSKTGENFSEYLTRIRMEYAARKLSSDSCKTYELAGSFGYRNPRYFSEAFKKFHGMTPSEYREKFGRQGQEGPPRQDQG